MEGDIDTMMNIIAVVMREHNSNDVSCKDYTTWKLNINLTLILTLTLTQTQYFDISFYCWLFSHSWTLEAPESDNYNGK